jgi:hypothetical protein
MLAGGAVDTDYLVMFSYVGFLALGAKSTHTIGCD